MLLAALLPVAAAAQTLEEARALQQKGALREAEQLYLALLPGVRENEPAAAGAALNALSQIAVAQGDYAAARGRALEALRIYRSLHDRAGEARALHNAGTAEMYGAAFDEALRAFGEALAIARARRLDELEVDELNNIGSVHYLRAAYLAALRSYNEALERVERSAAQPWSARKRGITIANLAALWQRLGQDERALELYARLRDESALLGRSEQARLLLNLGVLYRRLGDPVKALETYRRALRLLERDQNHDAQISALKNIGIVRALDFADLSGALHAFTSALDLAQRAGNRRESMQARLYRGEALLRRGALGAGAREFATALSAARELGTAEEAWKALYGLGRAARARGEEDVAARRFREAIVSIESARAGLQLPALKGEFLADKRDVYDALIELTLPSAGTAAIFDLLEQSRARTLQDRIPRSTPSLAAVQAHLDSETLLVEFWMGSGKAAALWATRDDAGLAGFDAPDAEVDRLVRSVSASDDGWRTIAASLGDRLLGRIPPLSRRGIRHLLLIPEGALARIPFEILSPDGATLLVERFDISYLPAAALLLRHPPHPRRSWAFPWERQLIVFAAPRVERAGHIAREDPFAGAHLEVPLPASAAEAEAIARASRGRSRLHLDSDDLKAHLQRGEAAGVPLLHLATHASADLQNPERSRILFSPARPGELADYLFLKEVYSLPLEGVDLATLSACETERGKSVRGEGVQAFSRALLAAGAQAAVTTLWRVGDEPARELMQQFYHELNQGVPKAEALQAAKLRLLRSGSLLGHPRFWAPFILTGDGLRPIPRVVPWSAFLALAGALTLSLTTLLRRSARRPWR